MFRRTLAGGLALAAAGLVLATAPAANAEIYAPYTRAAAIVNANGMLINSKNVINSRRAATGTYCVQVRSRVDVADSLIQLTPRHARRLPFIAYRSPSAVCGNEENTVTVQVYSTITNRPADGGFDLAIL
ncbi:hypothetical protein ACIBP6_15065 [Nonomuraea terrae]|uniref:hypothetical protein n=1 Tax=Nonomuraea terrae TaxID=2530383 RepID=UPI00379E31A9